MHLLFCAHLIGIFTFLRVLNLDIIFNLKFVGVPGLCNLFSFFYIQSLHNDCSYIKDVHPLFCTHFMIFFLIFGVLNLDIFSVKCYEGVLFV